MVYNYMILLVFYIRIGGAGGWQHLTQKPDPLSISPLKRGRSEERWPSLVGGGVKSGGLLWLGRSEERWPSLVGEE